MSTTRTGKIPQDLLDWLWESGELPSDLDKCRARRSSATTPALNCSLPSGPGTAGT
ncbi:hypothetical protein ACWGDT_16145 [Streptomyces avermitilis]